MTKKSHKLNYNSENKFILFGITSDEKDYKLIYDINQSNGWKLERQEDYNFLNRKTGENQQFPLFSYNDEENFITYRIISNKYEHHYLLQEINKIDFILIIADETGAENFSGLPALLKKIDSIRGVFPLEIEKLKSREKLVFDF